VAAWPWLPPPSPLVRQSRHARRGATTAARRPGSGRRRGPGSLLPLLRRSSRGMLGAGRRQQLARDIPLLLLQRDARPPLAPSSSRRRATEVDQFSLSPSLFLSSSPSLVPLSRCRPAAVRSFSGDVASRSGHRGARSGDGGSTFGHGEEPRARGSSLDATAVRSIGVDGGLNGLARVFF
jgi:hypothetical protein